MKTPLFRGAATALATPFDARGQVDFDALERLIDRQLERAAITSISGFAKLYDEAGKVLSIGG